MSQTAVSPRSRRSRLPFLAVLGPGIVVMLADTEVGSIITASQSGVAWGYRLLLLQFILIPILFVVQELTVRLGIFTGKGHGELIRDTFGKGWAWLSAGGLAVATVGALLSEFSGVAGVGELYGIPRAVTLTLAVVFLLVVAFTGSYRRVERVAIALGLFELVFFVIAFVSRPDVDQIAAQTFQPALGNPGYLYLVAANIGAVIMPWMIFYQQSAVADKRLTPADFKYARWDTAIGAVVTQLVMAAVLISTAATIGRHNPNASLDTVGDITAALTPYLGVAMGKLVFGAGVLGAGLVAAIVARRARRRAGGGHRRLARAGLGTWRGGRVSPLAGGSPAARKVVLRRLCRLPDPRRSAGRRSAEPRDPEHRRRGDERAAAAAGARLPGDARPQGAAAAGAAAGLVCRACHRDVGGHRGAWRLWRAVRGRPVLILPALS